MKKVKKKSEGQCYVEWELYHCLENIKTTHKISWVPNSKEYFYCNKSDFMNIFKEVRKVVDKYELINF